MTLDPKTAHELAMIERAEALLSGEELREIEERDQSIPRGDFAPDSGGTYHAAFRDRRALLGHVRAQAAGLTKACEAFDAVSARYLRERDGARAELENEAQTRAAAFSALRKSEVAHAQALAVLREVVTAMAVEQVDGFLEDAGRGEMALDRARELLKEGGERD